MLKFFRKIRQNLLSQNKFSKYLIYALGEILLVVIGILIALQLNTWKEEKKNNQVEVNYLKGILTNLDRDILELNFLLDDNTKKFNAYTEILKPFIDKNYNFNSSKLLIAIKDAQFNSGFNGHNIVFEDMQSSGKINFISSDILRFNILNYYDLSKRTSSAIDKKNATVFDTKFKLFTKNLDMNSLIEKYIFKGKMSAELDALDLSFFKLNKKNKDVIDFANKISLIKGILKENHNRSEKLIAEAKGLKENVQKYLSSKDLGQENKISKEILKAIKKGDTKTLSKLITKETLNYCFYEQFEYSNYLVVSISQQSISSLQFFVEQGVDIEGVCAKKTPLMYAVKYGQLDMVKYLLNNGANINAVNQGKTVLYYALTYQHPEIEKYLKDYISKQ